MKYFQDILGKRIDDNGNEIINLTRSVRIKDIVHDVHTENYQVKDGDTLDTIAFDVYGDVQFWWVVAVLNDIHDAFYDLPLTFESLKKWFDILVVDGEKVAGDWNDFVVENNAKRNIVVLKNKYLAEFIYLVERLIQE